MKQATLLAVPRHWQLPVVALGYFACVVGSIGFTRFDGGVAFIWFGNAFLIAWLARSPPAHHRAAVGVCLVSVTAATMAFGGRWSALPLALVAVAEAVATVHILRRLIGHANYFDSVRTVGLFALVAGGLVPAVCALVAGGVTYELMDKPFAANALGWFTGHALGTIALTPAMMLLLTPRRRRDAPVPVHGLETAALLFGVALTTFVVFAQNRLPLLFVPMLPMMLATLRLERIGAAVSIVLLMLVGGTLTTMGHGPITLIDGPQSARAQFLQFYVAASAGLVLPVAALLRQRGALLVDLSASEAAYRLLTESSGDAMFNLGLDGTIRYASRAVFSLAGFRPKDLVGTNARDLVLDEDKGRVIAAHAAAVREPGTTIAVEYRCRTADGRLLWFETRTRAIIGDRGQATGAVSAIREVSDRKAAESELARAASTDALTGLLNRRGFMAILERHVDTGSRGSAVAIVDLDHFKAVNDRWGHAVGDQVLCAFADVARRMLRASDTVGRIGGEEFALLLRDIDADRTVALCERLRAALEQATVMTSEGERVGVTASFGIARVGGACVGAEALKVADKALYEAKAMGRNQLRLAA